MTDAWRAFFCDLTTSDSFDDDPYAAATNQYGHALNGLFVAAGVFAAFYAIADVIPGKAWVFVVAMFPGLLVEGNQGWRGLDTLWDLWFRLCGIAIPTLSLTEDVTKTLTPDPRTLVAVTAVFFVSLAIYVAPRVARKYGAG